MLPFLDDVFGNTSSIHQVGRQARALLDDARDRAAKVLGSKPSELIFTSGGTESNNLAIFGTARALKYKGRHLITSAIEHHAVLHCFEYLARYEGFDLTVLPVDSEGRISPDALKAAFKPETVLVSLMAANNEIGTIQPITELGLICRENGIVFHTDAVQCFGKEPLQSIGQFNADLVSICAHKFHGPKGAGILYIRSPLQPHPIAFGGGHENERRAGTENLAGIVGMVDALESFVKKPVFDKHQLWSLTEKMIETNSQIPGIKFVGSRKDRLNNTVSFVVEGTDSISLLAGLDLEGVCASSGSACSAGSLEPSHVISALGVKRELANSLVRFSLGRDSTPEEVEQVCEIFPEVITRARGSKE
jgi:cysteine desulfurase